MPDQVIWNPPGEGDFFVAVDSEWRLLFAHGVGLRALGLSPEKVIGRDLWEVFSVYRGTRAEEVVRTVMEKRQPARMEMAGILTEGWYEMRIYPCEQGICMYGSDIADRKRAEDALRQSEQRYRVLTETVSSAVWTWDPENNQGDFAAT